MINKLIFFSACNKNVIVRYYSVRFTLKERVEYWKL